MKKVFFITGTDTGVGKTVATATLGLLLQKNGFDVGVMKPLQSSGTDAQFLRRILDLRDPPQDINPYYAPEPLSPHLALSRARIRFRKEAVLQAFHRLKAHHDILLVEGAGGLMVPIAKDYLMADLARDLEAELIIVARLGLGTINHTLLTVAQARERGLFVRGIIFNEYGSPRRGLSEQKNPGTIRALGRVKILGTVPKFSRLDRPTLLQKSRGCISLKEILSDRRRTNTARLAYLDKKYVWHPFTQMKDWLEDEPLVIDRAQGVWLFDTKGRRYIDGVSSLWVNVHGHGNKAIDAALRRQIGRLSHSTMLGLSNTPAVELAQRLSKIAPTGLTKVFYSDNGSTAVEIAIKMAYQYWQNQGRRAKTKIAHLANSYHGDTLGSVSVGGIDLFHKVYRKLMIKTIQVDFPDCYRAPAGKRYPDYAFECLARMEHLFRRKHEEIAAFVAEPIVQGAAGMIMWPEGILRRMAAICRQRDILFIADEVATGFGRTGKMFACEHERVSPDILCLAKGITGGYLPLAATLTTQKIFNGFLFPYQAQKTFFHGHTYTGNPLACAAALANLEIFEKENVVARLQPKIKHLARRLREFHALDHVGDIRQRGFMVGIELVRDKDTKEPFPWTERVGVRVCQEVRRRGVILRPLGNVIVLMPPLAISIKEMDQLLDATYGAIQQVTGPKIQVT